MDRTRWISAALVAALAATPAPRALNAQPADPAPPAEAIEAAQTEVAPPAPDAPQPPAEDVSPAERAARESRRLVEILDNPPGADAAAKRGVRDEAARRIAQRGGDAALETFTRILSLPGPDTRDARLSVVRAIPSSVAPPPELIPLIAGQLPDRVLTADAADALAWYKNSPAALTQLINFASNPQQAATQRTTVTRAIGTIPERRAANALARLMSDKEGIVRAVAVEALAELSGRHDLGADPQKWREWLARDANKSDAEWKADLLPARAAARDAMRRRNAELSAEIGTLLERQYRAAPRASRPAVLLEFLRSPVSDVRVKGVNLAAAAFNEGIINQPIRDRLIELVGDSSRDVRLRVALTLRTLNEQRAADTLLAQLAVEDDEEVRVAQISVFDAQYVADLRVIPLLRELLNHPSVVIGRAAAGGIRALAPTLLQNDPKLAREVAEDLNLLIRNTAEQPDAQPLREAAIQAIAPLRHPGFMPLARRLLTPRENVPVRRAALFGLGELGDPNAADMIVDFVGVEREPSVRLDAMTALGRVAGLEQADTLLRYMDPNVEPDRSVREGTRDVFRRLLPAASEAQLRRVAPPFRNDPEMHVAILQAWCRRLEERRDFENLALQRQNIGVDYLKLKRPNDAVQYLRQSLDYFVMKNEPGQVLESLILQLMDALLQSKQYGEAADFGASMIARDPEQQTTVGPKIKNEADRLQRDGRNEDALALIDAALRMDPPLIDRYVAQLREIREQARRPAGDAGAAPPRGAAVAQ